MIDVGFLDVLGSAAVAAASIPNLFAVFAGVLIGFVLGAIPGLNGTMAIALMIPLTFHWSPLFAIAILMGCWKGSVYGGSTSAILLNTPGTPEAAPTALDGYPLARQGKSQKALMMALVASVIGAVISDVLLIAAAPPISMLAIKFGPAELASLIVFSLIIVAGTGSDSVSKGLIATCLGLFLATVGLDPVDSQRRLTFDILHLDQGIDLLSMMIGLLVLSEVFVQLREQIAGAGGLVDPGPSKLGGEGLKWHELRASLGVIFRSSMIGSFCGALPGVGSVTAAFMGYDQARVTSDRPEAFGKGELKGVAAPEAANNAVCGTALVPMVTLGIPGSLSVAIIMGAFMIHGLAPGPMLMIEEPVFVYSLFILLLFSDIALFLVPLPLLPLAARVGRLPRAYLLPVITLFCFVGAYCTNQSLFDVQMMVFFGIIGYFLKVWGISAAALLIAYILAPMAEGNMRLALAISGGDATVFLTHPISAGFLIAGVGALIWIMRRHRNGHKVTADRVTSQAE